MNYTVNIARDLRRSASFPLSHLCQDLMSRKSFEDSDTIPRTPLLPYSSATASSWQDPPSSDHKRHPLRANILTWLFVMLPLICHTILTLAIGAFVLFYVDNRWFNINSRKPIFTYFSKWGTSIDYRPLQTDITTILSISLSVLRTFNGSWYTATSIRCAFILLQIEGLSFGELKWMLATNLPSIFRSILYRNGRSRFAILAAMVLLVALPAQYTAPILSGAIAWESGTSISMHTPISDVSIAVSGLGANSSNAAVSSWNDYMNSDYERQTTSAYAVKLATSAWADDSVSNGTLKRPINNYLTGDCSGTVASQNTVTNMTDVTVDNITLPYFSIDPSSWEWVSNISTSLNPSLLEGLSRNSSILNITSPSNPLLYNATEASMYTLALLFDTPWYSVSAESPEVAIPAPSMHNSTDGVVAIWVFQGFNGSCGSESEYYGENEGLSSFGELPANLDYYPYLAAKNPSYSYDPVITQCYAFAKFKYSAGVTTCEDCTFQGTSFVLNSSLVLASSIRAEPMVEQSLRILAETIQRMTIEGTNLPSRLNNIEAYTKEVLLRAYSASWTALTECIAGDGPHYAVANFSKPVPSTTARVSLPRLYVWFGLQMLAIVSGLLFIWLQSAAGVGLVRDTTMEVLLLDATNVAKNKTKSTYKHSNLRRRRRLRLQGKNGFIKLTYHDDEKYIEPDV